MGADRVVRARGPRGRGIIARPFLDRARAVLYRFGLIGVAALATSRAGGRGAQGNLQGSASGGLLATGGYGQMRDREQAAHGWNRFPAPDIPGSAGRSARSRAQIGSSWEGGCREFKRGDPRPLADISHRRIPGRAMSDAGTHIASRRCVAVSCTVLATPPSSRRTP